MTPDLEIARCLREIEAMQNQPGVDDAPAWLVTLGCLDWQAELELLLREREARER